MTDRIIEIADTPARLRIDLGRLAIEVANQPTVFVQLSEIAAVVVSNPGVTMSQTVLSELSKNGAAFVAMSENFLPIGMLLPLDAHSTQAARMGKQAEAAEPTKKRAWQSIIRAKIKAQWTLLDQVDSPLPGLEDLLSRVHSGDPENIEAQAASKYWRALFGDDFRRDRDAFDQNRLLNYGYAVLRAATARAICGAGLHPALGVQHHNQYNPFCLADDLMEPYRPMVDRVVHRIAGRDGPQVELGKAVRAEVVSSLLGRVSVKGSQRTLFDALSRSAASLARVLTGEDRDLELWVE
jgi:CRISPR-associated protein Cas1